MKWAAFLAFAGLAWCELPTCSLAPGWEQSGERRSFEGETLFEYMNGNSEGYHAYGFKKMTGVTCKKVGDTVIIDISDMGDAESAFGIFSSNRDVRSPTEPLGMGGQVVPRKAIFAKDRFYVEIAAETEKDHSATLRQLATILDQQIPGLSKPPEALSWFPTQGIEPGFPRLVPQSVLGIRLLKRGYVAHYSNGAKAFVVREVSSEAAATTLQKVKTRLAEISEVKTGEEAFVGTDKYLARMSVFRKGSFVAGFANLGDGVDAVRMTNALAAMLP